MASSQSRSRRYRVSSSFPFDNLHGFQAKTTNGAGVSATEHENPAEYVSNHFTQCILAQHYLYLGCRGLLIQIIMMQLQMTIVGILIIWVHSPVLHSSLLQSFQALSLPGNNKSIMKDLLLLNQMLALQKKVYLPPQMVCFSSIISCFSMVENKSALDSDPNNEVESSSSDSEVEGQSLIFHLVYSLYLTIVHLMPVPPPASKLCMSSSSCSGIFNDMPAAKGKGRARSPEQQVSNTVLDHITCIDEVSHSLRLCFKSTKIEEGNPKPLARRNWKNMPLNFHVSCWQAHWSV